MKRLVTLSAFIGIFCLSCGVSNTNLNSDSVSGDTTVRTPAIQSSAYWVAHAPLLNKLPLLNVPVVIHVDSSIGANEILTHEEAIALFPENFGIPEEVTVAAFAKQEIDLATYTIWFRMNVAGTENKDVWAVSYSETGPVSVQLFATKGNGLAYCKADSQTLFRQVLIDKGEMTVVTTKTIKIENGKFVPDNGQSTTYKSGQESDSQKAIDEFLK